MAFSVLFAQLILSIQVHYLHPQLDHSRSDHLTMVDSPTSPAHKKRHSVFGRLKNALTGRSKDKDTPSASQDPSTPELTTPHGANSGPTKPKADNSKSDDYNARDHWQAAYNALSESNRNTLMTMLPTITTEPQDAGRSWINEILDEVVKATESQYKAEQRREGIQTTAHKIINSALSFQDVVNTAVRFDPTGYASSAWAIVSLGLTVWSPHKEAKRLANGLDGQEPCRTTGRSA
jgi:hypothetical protein